MTHTLHRQGPLESLKNDYIIFAHTARGITRDGCGPKIQEFIRICSKYHPVNASDTKHGSIYQDGVTIERLTAEQEDRMGAIAVFTDLDALQKVVEELIRADLGLSINISGLLEEVQACCRRAGIERHSLEHSLGFWGSTDRLPEREILQLNTMCGHGMISFSLLRKLIDQVKLRRLTPKKAARIMAKCCKCGVLNPVRAERLLEKVRKGEKSGPTPRKG
jgi:hypothetical protein